ncbi:hypothetical protein ACO2KH_13555 [Leptospira terpstrae]|uniref:hypothetical protein n=1 Tax=Leptospira terpstrae TaxID=293075 RepID=UPI003D053E25
MPQFSLYQKVGLVCILLSLGVCSPNQTPIRNQLHSPSTFPFPITLPPHTKIQVLDTGIALILQGFQRGDSTVSFLWDTGSDISFYENMDGSYSSEFQIGERKIEIRRGEGILPKGIQGLLGLDVFQGTCLFYFGTEMFWFPGNSPFCSHPDAYLGTNLKILATKQKQGHIYVQFEYPKSFTSFAHIDTGASLNFLPKGENDQYIGEKRVFLPGNQILTLSHWGAAEPLVLLSKSGFREEYRQAQFLTGISLENFHLPGDKDKEEVWVIGLDILRTRPLFWDFTRGRVGIVHTKN